MQRGMQEHCRWADWAARLALDSCQRNLTGRALRGPAYNDGGCMGEISAGLPEMAIGYRAELGREIERLKLETRYLEVIADQFIGQTPERFELAVELADDFIVVPHSLELSIGSIDAYDRAYAEELVAFAHTLGAPWFSDHLCFTRTRRVRLNSLTPVERTRDMARMVARRACELQQAAGIPFLLENITYHVDLGGELSEHEFLQEVLELSGCGLLLDLANVEINAHNHGYDPYEFLSRIPLERVMQVHLAGGEEYGGILYDSHSHDTPASVWKLLEFVVSQASPRAVVIERDSNFPSDLSSVWAELSFGNDILTRTSC